MTPAFNNWLHYVVNSRNINDLDPAARLICNDHMARCRHAGIELIVTSTWRDYEAQDALYAIGRTVQKERRPVTDAKAGHSWHNFKVAWDVVPVVAGKPVWNEKNPIWQEVVTHGKAAGALAGADWKSFPDLPHFYTTPSISGLHISIDEARDRFNTSGTIFA